MLRLELSKKTSKGSLFFLKIIPIQVGRKDSADTTFSPRIKYTLRKKNKHRERFQRAMKARER